VIYDVSSSIFKLKEMYSILKTLMKFCITPKSVIPESEIIYSATILLGWFTLERSGTEQSFIFNSFYFVLSEAYQPFVQRCSLVVTAVLQSLLHSASLHTLSFATLSFATHKCE